MEQNRKAVTVTLTENGEQVFSSTENILFVVGVNKGVMLADCKVCDLFEFAVMVQEQFFNRLLPQLLQDCKPGVTLEMLFNAIIDLAKTHINEVH